ncbi:MAG: hypothetical protein EP329_26510 [Deltaproteobacteria bacterium]|nr:MAG: hypothetical protein EP329_26510 [Deltaproteobacteria bacterium]
MLQRFKGHHRPARHHREPAPFWVYGHRGASAERPENTIEAFALALELGADALETDVHVTRDGHVVIFHDASGARTCGRPEAIAATDLATVRAWDAGEGFVAADGTRPFAGRGVRVPTLLEVLERFPETRLNIDIKAHRLDAVRQVVNTVMRANAAPRVLLTSSNDRVVRQVRRTGYTGPTGIGGSGAVRLMATPTPLVRWRRPPGDALQIPHAVRGRSLGREWLISRCHAVGIRVDFWTVNDPEIATQLVAAGADGIMTDDPRAVVPAARAARDARG